MQKDWNEELSHFTYCRDIIQQNITHYEAEYTERHEQAQELYKAINSGDVELYNQLMTTTSLEEHAAQSLRKNLAALQKPMLEYETLEGYNDVLNISGNGMMGYITVPKINQELPVYHGTSDAVLAVAAGHFEGPS